MMQGAGCKLQGKIITATITIELPIHHAPCTF
jgi:hypothetical protein